MRFRPLAFVLASAFSLLAPSARAQTAAPPTTPARENPTPAAPLPPDLPTHLFVSRPTLRLGSGLVFSASDIHFQIEVRAGIELMVGPEHPLLRARGRYWTPIIRPEVGYTLYGEATHLGSLGLCVGAGEGEWAGVLSVSGLVGTGAAGLQYGARVSARWELFTGVAGLEVGWQYRNVGGQDVHEGLVLLSIDFGFVPLVYLVAGRMRPH